jgi:hypothetical protein
MKVLGSPHKKRSPKWLVGVKAALLIAALIIYIFPPPALWVDRYYSTLFYPRLQSVVTRVSNLFPFALFDLFAIAAAVGVLVWWVIRIRSAASGRRGRALLLLFYDTAALSACLFLIFEAMWGLNYVREPLARKLDYDQDRIDSAVVRQLAHQSLANLNAASGPAHLEPWPDDDEWRKRLEPSFQAVVGELGNPVSGVTGRRKSSLFNFYLSATGIDGFTDPFAHEVILNSELLPIERPFVLGHEWAHLAGFADESEANFIALLTCVRSDDAAVRYAGWLELYPRLARVTLPGAAAAAPGTVSHASPDSQVLEDLQAISKRRSVHLKGWASDAQWRLYDRFLKANRVVNGVASYDTFVRLLLGTRFGPDWTPARRPQP